MKINILKLWIIALAIMMPSMGALAQKTDEVKAKIEKINKEMATAMMDGNYEKNMVYYTDDVISLPSYEKMIEGIEALKASQAEMVKMDMKVKLFETVTKKVMVNGNMITEIGTYKISFTMAGSENAMEDVGKYVTIWEKQKDGSLKIKVETWNTDSNPWQAGNH